MPDLIRVPVLAGNILDRVLASAPSRRSVCGALPKKVS